MKRIAIISLVVSGLLMAGCAAPPIKPVLSDPDPSVKIPAIALAVKQHDLSAVPTLIKNLDDDDPAIRFYSSDALQKLTGQDFGYLYYEDREQRAAAIAKWGAWWTSKQPSAATVPGTTAR
jgi:hypothetical protein